MIEWLSEIQPIHLSAIIIILLFFNSSVMVPPSETLFIMIGFSFFHSSWYFLILTLLLGVLANLAGTTIWYFIGRKIGKSNISIQHNNPSKIKFPLFFNKLIEFSVTIFKELGEKSVFWLRLIPIVRSIISLPAGIVGMDSIRFVYLSFFGILVWGAFWVLIGAFFNKLYISYSIYITLPLILIVFIVYHKSTLRLVRMMFK